MEENINQVQQRAESHLQSKLNQYKQWKNKADVEYSNQQSAQMETDTMNLYKSGLEATDTETKKKYQVASRANLLAEMISNTAKEKGVELTGNAKDIVSSYLKGFPDDYQKLVDFTHSNQDPEEFAIEMGWMQAPEKESSTFTNIVGGAYDSATGIPRMIGKGTANVIGWVAKQFGADDERVNELVQSYKDYLDSDWSAKAIGADTDSGAYKASKVVSDLAQTAALGKLGGVALESKLGMPLATSTDPLRAKALAGATEGAADMGIYSAVSDSELPSGKDLAIGATLGAAVPIAGAGLKAASNAVKKGAVKAAEDTIGTLNKMSKSKQSKFFQRVGEKYTKWMNDRGIKNGSDLIEYFETSKNLVDDGLSKIEGTYKSQALDDVMDDVVKYSQKTKDPMYERLLELQTKSKNEGLTMSETNEVKRYFEKKRKFSYGKDVTSQDRDLYTNMDNNLRERQFDIAKQNGFNDIAELNKETQNAYAIWKGIDNNEALNSSLGLTDWLVIAKDGVSASTLKGMIAKKVFEAPRFKEAMVDILNKIGRHQKIGNKVMDMVSLTEVKTQKDLQKWLSVEWDDLGDVAQTAAIAGLENSND